MGVLDDSTLGGVIRIRNARVQKLNIAFQLVNSRLPIVSVVGTPWFPAVIPWLESLLKIAHTDDVRAGSLANRAIVGPFFRPLRKLVMRHPCCSESLALSECSEQFLQTREAYWISRIAKRGRRAKQVQGTERAHVTERSGAEDRRDRDS